MANKIFHLTEGTIHTELFFAGSIHRLEDSTSQNPSTVDREVVLVESSMMEDPSPSNSSAAALHPPLFSYIDSEDCSCQIYISPGRWDEANQLLIDKDWEALSQFPPWSDQPPLPPAHVNQMNYTDGRDGTKRSIYLPRGSDKRATQLFVNEDWASLEKEFEVWGEF